MFNVVIIIKFISVPLLFPLVVGIGNLKLIIVLFIHLFFNNVILLFCQNCVYLLQFILNSKETNNFIIKRKCYKVNNSIIFFVIHFIIHNFAVFEMLNKITLKFVRWNKRLKFDMILSTLKVILKYDF